MNTLRIKLLTVSAFFTMIATNYLAIALPLAGKDTGAISDSYPNLFAPAGYTFSIWGIIYMLLGIYTIYQLQRKKDSLVTQINKLFIINAFLNALWIFTWHYEVIWLSVLIMIGILISLIKITHIFRGHSLTKKEWICIPLPFSVYFGWITVATIANITVFLVKINWNGFGFSESIWTIIVLLIGAGIGVYRTIYDRSIPYGLVLVWAYGGILMKHLSQNGFAFQFPLIIYTLLLCIITLIASISLLVIKPYFAEKIIRN